MKKFAAFCMLFTAFYAAAQEKPYFQQEVNYTIQVSLDDRQHMLHGSESFEYINNSPDVLDVLYIHLWPNAYKNKSTALARQLARDGNYVLYYALKDDKGFIDSLDFQVNGVRAQWSFDDENIDIARITLPKPLPPGGRITVTTPFRVKIPSGSISRLGHVGESYQVTQWYPKPAVYDRNGWHQMPYLTQGEFYSEFGSFDVSITLPANYVVGATGDLQSPSEVAFMDSLAALGLQRPDLENLNADFPPSSPRMKTIRFVQSRVHDFGWFADKRWMVLKGQVTTPHTSNVVTTWALFTPTEKELWAKAPEYLHDATYYYSLWNGDYPYKQVTAVDGTISAGGGMEYPNVTVIGRAGNAWVLETVIMHEVGHNWFYGILGSNERIHAWMDEGINSFNEDRYMVRKYPDATLGDALNLVGAIGKIIDLSDFSQRTLTDVMYRMNASRALDQPLNCASDHFTSMNYGGMVYKKTALLFNYLQAYLGEERFDKAMQAYFEEWKFKHPTPADLRRSIEQSAGEDLSWFFNELINTSEKIDFSIRSAKVQQDGSVRVHIRNTGQTTGPAVVSTVRVDEKGKETELRSASSPVITPGQRAEVVIPAGQDAPDRIVIDPGRNIPQINLQNDRMRAHGIFRKIEPISFRPISGLENPRKSQVFFLPVVGWNEYDNWMPGLWLHNRTITRKAFEWSASPLYSFTTEQVNGFARMIYNIGRFSAGIRGQRFSIVNEQSALTTVNTRYEMAEPYLSYSIRPALSDPNDRMRIDLEASYQALFRTAEFQPEGEPAGTIARDQEALRLQASARLRKGLFNTYKARLSLAQEANLFNSDGRENFDVGHVVSGEVSYSRRYNLRKSKDISFRAFYGFTGGSDSGWNLFQPSGVTGQADAFTDNLYLGRLEADGLAARQMVNGMGMLRTFVPAYFTEMVAVNAEIELPVKFPLLVSFNAVASGFNELVDSDRVFGSAVVTIPFLSDVLEVHLPVLVTSRIDQFYDTADYTYFDRIMFTLNLNALAPFNTIRNIEP